MPDLGKAVGQRAPDLFGRAVGALQGGKARLDSGVAALQRIIVGIRDLWRIVGVIGAVGTVENGCKTGKFGTRLIFVQLWHGFVLHDPPPIDTFLK